MISDADIQPLADDLFRVRIPTAMAHALNCYLWLGPDGVTVVDKIESYDYGKFVHILDPEGNKIELWEPTAE